MNVSIAVNCSEEVDTVEPCGGHADDVIDRPELETCTGLVSIRPRLQFVEITYMYSWLDALVHFFRGHLPVFTTVLKLAVL